MNFELHETLLKTIQMFKVIEQGSTFNSFMQDIKFQAILSSPIDVLKIAHIVKKYSTCPKKYQTGFKMAIKASEEDRVLKLDKITSKDIV